MIFREPQGYHQFEHSGETFLIEYYFEPEDPKLSYFTLMVAVKSQDVWLRNFGFHIGIDKRQFVGVQARLDWTTDSQSSFFADAAVHIASNILEESHLKASFPDNTIYPTFIVDIIQFLESGRIIVNKKSGKGK